MVRLGRGPRIFPVSLLVLFLLASIAPAVLGQDSNRPPAAVQSEATNNEATLQTYLQLQEQIHALQLVLERSREESDAAAARNTELMAGRLQAVEQSLNVAHSREWQAMQSSNHTMIVVAAVFAGVGMVAMLLTAMFQWRTVHRLTDISANLPPFRSLGPPPVVSALGPSDSHLPPGSAAVHSNMRLLGAIDRLEQRLHELENATQAHGEENHAAPARTEENHAAAPSQELAPAPANGKPQNVVASETPEVASAQRVTVLLAKGQSLFNLDQLEEALTVYEEIVALEPRHAEALVRKGAVLERLRRFDEAHECYDRAIAADGSLTIAYLYKGGLFNRQERFGEALHCYEQALRAKEKTSPVS